MDFKVEIYNVNFVIIFRFVRPDQQRRRLRLRRIRLANVGSNQETDRCQSHRIFESHETLFALA